MKREVAYLERSKAAVVYQDKWRFAQGNNIAEGIVQKTIESNATES